MSEFRHDIHPDVIPLVGEVLEYEKYLQNIKVSQITDKSHLLVSEYTRLIKGKGKFLTNLMLDKIELFTGIEQDQLLELLEKARLAREEIQQNVKQALILDTSHRGFSLRDPDAVFERSFKLSDTHTSNWELTGRGQFGFSDPVGLFTISGINPRLMRAAIAGEQTTSGYPFAQALVDLPASAIAPYRLYRETRDLVKPDTFR